MAKKKITAKKTAKKSPAKASGKNAAAKRSTDETKVKQSASKKSTAAQTSSKQANPKRTSTKKIVAKPQDTKGAQNVGSAKKKQSPIQSLESKLRDWLAAKKKIAISWDCGGDEALLYGKINKETWSWEDKDFLTLCGILIEKLQLPDAGEEFNKGGGNIELKGGEVVLVYDAKFFGVEWDEESGEIFEREPEQRSGELKLFKALGLQK